MWSSIWYQYLRYTTTTDKVIDKTVSNSVLFGIAIKTTKRHHTACTKNVITKKKHFDLINIQILIPGSYRYKKIPVAVISHPGDNLPKNMFLVYLNMYIYRKDGAYFSYLVDRNKTCLYPLESPSCYLLYDTKTLDNTTITENVIDKTVSHYVLFGNAVKTSKRLHTTCTKMAITKKSPHVELINITILIPG